MEVTLKDIAEAGGFSITAVSRALSGKDGVSEETRQKIQAIAKEMGYVPNIVARSLRTKRTKTLGVIIEDITKPYFGKIVKGIDDTAKALGYDILICNTNLDPAQELRSVNTLLQRSVDGIIFHPSQLTDKGVKLLKKSGIPFVCISRRFPNIKTDYVITNNRDGIKTIFNYLVSKGCRNILFINSPTFSSSSQDRMVGYREALQENGFEYREELVMISKSNFEAAYSSMLQWIDQKVNFDSVLCGRDEIAIGVMEALLERGYRIPDDIRITGYDDLDSSRYLKIPLTTMHQPVYEIGQKSVEILINWINSKTAKTGFEEVVLSSKLIVRASA